MHTKIRFIKYWFQRRIRGWSDDETWNLDWEFILWVNSRYKKFLELADKRIDLNVRKIMIDGYEYTFREAVAKTINLSDYLKKTFFDYNCNNQDKDYDKLLNLFEATIGYMSW